MQNIDLICVGKLNAKYFAEGEVHLRRQPVGVECFRRAVCQQRRVVFQSLLPQNVRAAALKAAAALVEGRYRGKLAAGRKDLVVAALARRGFAYPVIKEAIRRVEEDG